MAVNTLASNFAGDVSTYIAAKLLLLAKKNLILFGMCDKSKLPKNSSRTIQYTRYDRVALPQVTLVEGVTPGDTSMAITTVTAVMDQWGAVIPVSDVAIDSVKHPVLQQAIKLAALQAKETVDREIAKVLLTGTNIFFPDGITTRASLNAAAILDTDIIGAAVASLRNAGAMPKVSSHYIGAVHPWSEDDLLKNSSFIEAVRYQNAVRLFNGEIGTWKGVRWMRSNALPFIHLLTGATGATSTDAGGSLANATAFDFKVSVVDALTGFETFVQAKLDVTTGAGDEVIKITLPALPSGATAASTFNVYAGSDGGTLFLSSTGHAALDVVSVLVIPTSGDVAEATPPAAKTVYHAFVFGTESVICAELNKIRAFLTPNVPSDSDPLVQRRKVGWKLDFKTVIPNDAFLARIEHTTTNGDIQ